jgi:hypothetical protein
MSMVSGCRPLVLSTTTNVVVRGELNHFDRPEMAGLLFVK